MLSKLITWFDALPLSVILFVGVALILLEYVISKNKMLTFKIKKWILINLWQVFGVLFPSLWLLRAADNYKHVVVLFGMMVIFGIIKPTRLHKIKNQTTSLN